MPTSRAAVHVVPLVLLSAACGGRFDEEEAGEIAECALLCEAYEDAYPEQEVDDRRCTIRCLEEGPAELEAALARADSADDPDGDLDEDGVTNAGEGACNTSPHDADTDDDGVLDGDEDADGDGATCAEELAAGTDPANGASAPVHAE